MFPKINFSEDNGKDWMKSKVEPYLPQEPTDLLENMFVEHQRAESNLLKQVLVKHIGRDPTIEDWRKCQKINGDLQSFTFFYNGYYLGRFVREIKNNFDEKLHSYVVTVTFSFEPK